MTIWLMHIACWMPKATNTHTQNMQYLLLFYCNMICTKALQCYVIRILLVLLGLCLSVCLFLVHYRRSSGKWDISLNSTFPIQAVSCVLFLIIFFWRPCASEYRSIYLSSSTHGRQRPTGYCCSSVRHTNTLRWKLRDPNGKVEVLR
jgi:hypothetical protein